MWVLACAKYGTQGAFGALDDVFGGAFGAREGASEVDRGARAQCAPPLGAPLTAASTSRQCSKSHGNRLRARLRPAKSARL